MQLQYLDHYKLLNIAADATPADIMLAYDAAIRQLPDKWTAVLFAQIRGRTAQRFTKAYEELIDPASRASYDAYLLRVSSTPQFLIF